MNPRIKRLQPYPFERMNAMKAGLTPNPELAHVSLSIGEPQHAPPDFIVDYLTDPGTVRENLGKYPGTRGSEALRSTISQWLASRFGATVDASHGILPVAGTREALFSFGQSVLTGDGVTLLPNPFYQIYEGAALLGGSEVVFTNCVADNNYLPDYRKIDPDTWRRTELLYLCSPGNPTGAVLGLEELTWLIEQAHRYNFVIAADECYSEIFLSETNPPAGLLAASQAMGNHSDTQGHARCVVFHSLSKRSNLPGLRSGFVAGDHSVLADYFQYRTYSGCALPNHVQAASELAWKDEAHVIDNRSRYRRKFAEVTRVLAPHFPLVEPQGGFYHWLPTPIDDVEFTRELFLQQNVTVLPGSFLSRDTPTGSVRNPGKNHVRVAWVATAQACRDAAMRLAEFARTL